MKDPGMIRVDDKRPANEDETLRANILFGTAAQLLGTSDVVGVVVVARTGEVVPGGGPGAVIRLISVPETRGDVLSILARFVEDRRDEIPRGPGRAA